MRVTALAALALMLATGTAHAQAIRLRIVDATAATPVAGAFVTLLDSAGSKAAASLADTAGIVQLRAPRAGTWTVRVERLGYETHDVAGILVENGTVLQRDIAVPGRAVTLPAVSATAGTRCTGRRDLAASAAVIWAEAQKAFAIARWTAGSEPIRWVVDERDVTTDADGRNYRVQRSESRAFYNSRGPYESISADSLMTRGFVQTAAGGKADWIYFGPDSDVLLSDRFVDGHCFRETVQRDSLVGLRFQPRGPDMNLGLYGTVWLRRDGLTIHSLDFTYGWLPYGAESPRAGGRIEYGQLASGGIIVSAWTLRAPILRETSIGVSRGILAQRGAVTGFTEFRRVVTGAFRLDGTPIPVGRGR